MAAPKNPALTRLQALAPTASPKGGSSSSNLELSATPAKSLPLPTPLSTPSTSAGFSSRFPTAVPSKNPIALRLYKVLGANYHDASTREALETLSSFYAPPELPSSPPEPVARPPATAVTVNGKQPTHEEDEEEDEEGEEAWGAEYVKARRKDALSEPARLEIDGEAALRARKNLRRDVEIKLADSSRKFLAAFAEVDQVCD